MLVRDEWTDINAHMNMAYYHVLFDQAMDMVLAPFGFSPEDIKRTGKSIFMVQAQIHYLRELSAGTSVLIDTFFIARDGKRLHFAQSMRHASEDWTAAITENMLLHVDLNTRRAATWPETFSVRMDEALVAHQALTLPRQIGRRVGLPRP